MTRTERRIVHVYFPFLSTDRIAARGRGAGQERELTVTVSKAAGAMVLSSVDRRSLAAGLRPAMPLAQARALVPNIKVHTADPHGDAALLEALACACDRYTPLVARDRPCGLFLDISRCAHLFGGEDGLLADLTVRLARWGLTAQRAVADNPALAWAIARYGDGGIAPKGEGLERVRPLPAEAMRLPAEMVATLARLGLKTVGHVLAQPRAPLVQRFGPLIARRIDQLAGREREPIDPDRPVAPYVAERTFAEPIANIPAILAALETLSQRLCVSMRASGEGARALRVCLFHADGAVRDFTVGTSEPLDDPLRIAMLLRPRLEALSQRVETESGVDLIRLHGEETERTVARQPRLDGPQDVSVELSRLIDTLSERLGIRAVHRLSEADTHQPEWVDVPIPAREVRAAHASAALDPSPRGRVPLRPFRMFDPPEPIDTLASVPDGPPVRFRWRRVLYQVALAEGPERIAPQWWREGGDPTRDYFRVEDREGRRFWLYRSGLYDRAHEAPRWFIQGLFA